MQNRHIDRYRYFQESAKTSRAHYIRYVNKYMPLNDSMRILEVGCGEGGNLLPFAELGISVSGIDLSAERIEQARSFFAKTKNRGSFLNIDFLKMDLPNENDLYDVILVHDVIEHIEPMYKREFVNRLQYFLKKNGVIFFRFPAWEMPFGGHQQICKSIVSKIPFTHLLPNIIYKKYLALFGESPRCIKELLSIKRSKMTVEGFEKLICDLGYKIKDRTLWFINPHYTVKFNIPAIKLNRSLSSIYYIRNFLSTSCFYIITLK